MIKILLIDDEPNVIQGWRMRLALEDDLAVVGDARDLETAPLMARAGADVLVAGSAVFKGGSVSDPAPYGANIRAIRAAAEGVWA